MHKQTKTILLTAVFVSAAFGCASGGTPAKIVFVPVAEKMVNFSTEKKGCQFGLEGEGCKEKPDVCLDLYSLHSKSVKYSELCTATKDCESMKSKSSKYVPKSQFGGGMERGFGLYCEEDKVKCDKEKLWVTPQALLERITGRKMKKIAAYTQAKFEKGGKVLDINEVCGIYE